MRKLPRIELPEKRKQTRSEIDLPQNGTNEQGDVASGSGDIPGPMTKTCIDHEAWCT